MGNPADKYALVVLTGNINDDEAEINIQADKGYRFVAYLGGALADHGVNYVLMGNYGG